jgi:hypothetical protein
MTTSYDRIDGESTKAYTAFMLYRDMGATRSLTLVAEKIYTPQSPHNPPRNISQIERWSSQWNWVDRCKDYDLDRERERRQIKSEHEKAAYLQELEHYHLQQKAIGIAALNFTARSLDALSFILEPIHQAIQESAVLTPDQIDVLFSSQIAAKNLMGAATSGAQMTAKGLVIEELMAVIESKLEAHSGGI